MSREQPAAASVAECIEMCRTAQFALTYPSTAAPSAFDCVCSESLDALPAAPCRVPCAGPCQHEDCPDRSCGNGRAEHTPPPPPPRAWTVHRVPAAAPPLRRLRVLAARDASNPAGGGGVSIAVGSTAAALALVMSAAAVVAVHRRKAHSVRDHAAAAAAPAFARESRPKAARAVLVGDSIVIGLSKSSLRPRHLVNSARENTVEGVRAAEAGPTAAEPAFAVREDIADDDGDDDDASLSDIGDDPADLKEIVSFYYAEQDVRVVEIPADVAIVAESDGRFEEGNEPEPEAATVQSSVIKALRRISRVAHSRNAALAADRRVEDVYFDLDEMVAGYDDTVQTDNCLVVEP
ncbi:hypothetical protein HDU84_000307 [Entophlyctis sp. JEL0112]|nr:hypothetical protein HDU84_000307 [Entophlyctis sp. JEL0112]